MSLVKLHQIPRPINPSSTPKVIKSKLFGIEIVFFWRFDFLPNHHHFQNIQFTLTKERINKRDMELFYQTDFCLHFDLLIGMVFKKSKAKIECFVENLYEIVWGNQDKPYLM